MFWSQNLSDELGAKFCEVAPRTRKRQGLKGCVTEMIILWSNDKLPELTNISATMVKTDCIGQATVENHA